MANEITLNLKLQVLKGSLAHLENPGAISVDLSGSTATGGSQTIASSAGGTALNMGSVSSAGYAYFRNIDSAITIEIGTNTGTFAAFAKLKAGEAAIIRLGTNAPYAKAASSSANLQYFILAD